MRGGWEGQTAALMHIKKSFHMLAATNNSVCSTTPGTNLKILNHKRVAQVKFIFAVNF